MCLQVDELCCEVLGWLLWSFSWVVAIIIEEECGWTRLEITVTIRRSMLYVRPRKEPYKSNTEVTQEQISPTREIITWCFQKLRWCQFPTVIEGFSVKNWSWINFSFRFPTIMSGLNMPQMWIPTVFCTYSYVIREKRWVYHINFIPIFFILG